MLISLEEEEEDHRDYILIDLACSSAIHHHVVRATKRAGIAQHLVSPHGLLSLIMKPMVVW